MKQILKVSDMNNLLSIRNEKKFENLKYNYKRSMCLKTVNYFFYVYCNINFSFFQLIIIKKQMQRICNTHSHTLNK